jgi:hypothetical protein
VKKLQVPLQDWFDTIWNWTLSKILNPESGFIWIWFRIRNSYSSSVQMILKIFTQSFKTYRYFTKRTHQYYYYNGTRSTDQIIKLLIILMFLIFVKDNIQFRI